MSDSNALACKVLAAAHISVADRIAILKTINNVLPIRRYCQRLLKRDDVAAEIKIGAREIVAYEELVRHSVRSAGAKPQEFMRAASSTECAFVPAELVRTSDASQ